MPTEQPQSYTKFWIVMILIALAIGWWMTGSMDPALVNVGLNKNPCIGTIAGTLCGDNAEQFCDRPIAREAEACRDLATD